MSFSGYVHYNIYNDACYFIQVYKLHVDNLQFFYRYIYIMKINPMWVV